MTYFRAAGVYPDNSVVGILKRMEKLLEMLVNKMCSHEARLKALEGKK